MRIKKIEVLGFKSFADKQVVVLDDRITAILGPNGCGKSNIVDAMRWCLGEQRAKHLRGSGMSDVIFSGCATRGPAGMAEVTLTFENDGDSPSAYLKFAEIGVTRRLFSDGTSEYLINRVPCRLRDINDLLAGTGIGTKGYSIIEQGRVGQIVTSKPETRRQVIDEAAGITRFKVQKITAERKIAQTEQNLLRVADVIRELDSRLGVLRRQAQKAERYKRYRGEQSDLELWMASHRDLELRATGRVLEHRCAELGENVEGLRQKVAGHDTRLEAGRLSLTELDTRLSTEQQRLYDLENRIGYIEQDRRYKLQEQEALRRSVDQSRAESTGVSGVLSSLHEELAGIVTQQDSLGGDSEQGQESQQENVAHLSERHDTANLQLRDTQIEVQRLRGVEAQTNTRVASLDAHLLSRAEGIVEMEDRLSLIGGEIEGLEREGQHEQQALETAQIESNSAQENSRALRERRIELDGEKSALRESLRGAEVEVEASSKPLLRARSRLQSLEEIQNRYQGCASGVQVVMEHKEQLAEAGRELDGGAAASDISTRAPAVLGIMADFISAPAEYESAVGAVFGERLQGVVVDEPRTGASGVELLRQLQEGRTTFLPASLPCEQGGGETAGKSAADADGSEAKASFSEDGSRAGSWLHLEGVQGLLCDLVNIDARVDSLARALIGDAVVVDTLARALELWNRVRLEGSNVPTFVTLQGDRIDPTGVVVGGSVNAVESALLQQKREIAELLQSVETLDKEFQLARDLQRGLAERLSVVEEAREKSEGELLDGEKVRLGASQQVDSLAAAVERCGKQVQGLHRTAEELRSGLERRQEERENYELELAELRAELPERAEAIAEQAEKLEALDGQREELAAQLTEAKVALASWQEQRAALVGSRDRLERQISSEKARARRLEESAVESEKRVGELEIAVEEMAAEHSALLEEHKVSTEAKHDASEACDAARLTVAELEVAVRNLRQDLDEERERLSEVELGLRELVLEREHLTSDIRDRFDAELSLLLIDHHDRPSPTREHAERVKELKRILSRMGEVNLTAISEFEEVSQRFDYLTTQRGDLQDAIVTLQDAIDKINETTRERFKDTFDQVNAYFQKLFPRLFNGGRAELVMTDPSNLLETGIDIFAQPPGKKVSSLELLSGGEKALTAVSLVFGIFLMKSSPFCLLDEVDAPLDEANVGRFCDMVRELSERTQFIIITHNKRTMEIADRLYGVTMQQRGVSKLVSVNMRRTVSEASFS